MLKFHPLEVVQLTPDAEDAVAIALAVPPELREEYTGAASRGVKLPFGGSTSSSSPGRSCSAR